MTNETKQYSILLLAILAILVFFPFLETGFTTNDDAANQLLNYQWFIDTAYLQGRVQFLLFHWLIIKISYLLDSLVFIKFITVAMVLANISYFSYFLSKYIENKYMAYLLAVFALVFIQDSWEHYLITSSALIYTTAFLFFFIALNLFIKYKETKKRYFLYFSGFVYIFAMQISEMYFLLFILYPIINLKYTKSLKQHFKDITIPFMFYATYIAIYIIFRYFIADGSSYDGNQVSNDFSIINFFKTLTIYSISPLPGYLFLNNNFAMMGDINIYLDFEGLLSLKDGFFNNYLIGVKYLTQNFYKIEVIWIVKYMIFSFVLINYWDKIAINKKSFILLLIISLVLIFFPNIPHALTSKYQYWALFSGSTGYVGTYISFFGISLLCILILTLISSLIKRRLIKKIVIFILVILLLPLSLFTSMTNDATLKSKIMTNKKWEIVQNFTRTQTFKNIEEGSIIYAPTLFGGCRGIISQHEVSYWNNYIYLISGKRVSIIKVLTPSIVKDFKKIYYLEYQQNRHEEGQCLTFAKIDKFDNSKDIFSYKLYTHEFSIFPYSKIIKSKLFFETDFYNSIVSVERRESDSSNIVDTEILKDENGFFGYVVENKGKTNKGLEYLFNSQDEILLNNIYIEGYLNKKIIKNPKNERKFSNLNLAKGFYATEHNEEFSWNWADKRSLIEVNNNTKHNLKVNVDFTLKTAFNEYSKIRLRLNEKVIDEINVNNKGYHLLAVMSLIPGVNKIHLEVINGKKVIAKSDDRRMFFNISKYRISNVDSISQSFLSLKEPIFGEGFYPWETNGIETWRWSKQKSSIEIFNNVTNDTRVKLSVKCMGATRKYSKIKISLNDKTLDEVNINDESYIYETILNLKPGNNKLKFNILDGDKIPNSVDKRDLYFLIGDLYFKKLDNE